MYKSVGEVVDLRPQTFQQQPVPTSAPKRLLGLYPWLRFGFFPRSDWIEAFAINLELIEERAADAYFEGEAAFFEPFLEDYVPALGKERVLEIKQRKLETVRGQFTHAATKLCQSPIERIMLAGLIWTKYGYENGLVEIWNSTSRCPKPQADVVIAPQYWIDKYRVDFAIFINVTNEEIKIAVECDGHWHAESKQQVAYDTKRKRDVEIAGWKVPTFTGSEIYRDHKACADHVSRLANTEIDAQLRRRGLK